MSDDRARDIDMQWYLKGVKSRFDHDVQFYDDGIGGLYYYADADFVTGIVRAQTWYDAYEIVEDEFLARATHEEIEADFPGYSDYEKWEREADDHTKACFEEAYGISGNNGWYHKCLNGDRLCELTPKLLAELEWKLRWGNNERDRDEAITCKCCGKTRYKLTDRLCNECLEVKNVG